MDKDASTLSASQEIARRLLAGQESSRKDREPETTGAALQRACQRVSENLREAMGEDGCSALLTRALARTEAKHPALKSIRRLNDGTVHLDGVAAAVEEHGVAAATAALEALLAALLNILGRLIGEDMAIRLIDQDHPRGGPGARS